MTSKNPIVANALSVYTNGISDGLSVDDGGKKCLREVGETLKALERKTAALKQAIAWIKQSYGKA